MSTGVIYSLGAIAIAALIVIGGYTLILNRMKAKDQGIDRAAIQAMGMVTFLPVLLIASAGGFMQSDALSALLGAVGGYVLARGTEKDTQ
jgi:uncharacterized membrane protein